LRTSSSLSTLQEQTIMKTEKPFGDAPPSIGKWALGRKRKSRLFEQFQSDGRNRLESV
jgi:hypothetical protein